MIKTNWLRKMVCGLSLIALGPATTGPCFGEPVPIPLNRTDIQARDVRLTSDRAFELQLVDRQGRGLSGVQVQLGYEGRIIAEGRSNEDGRLVLAGLRPGLHTLTAGRAVQQVRLWNDETAPDIAVRNLALVSEESVVRGQFGSDSQTVPTTGHYSFGGVEISPLTVGAIAFGIVATVKIIQLEDDVDRLQAASP